MEKTIDAARQWIIDGKPCRKARGLTYRYSNYKPTSCGSEEALAELDSGKWNFGMGFHELEWITDAGETVLCFHEYSENDLY